MGAHHVHWDRWLGLWQATLDAVRARGGTASPLEVAPPARMLDATARALPDSLQRIVRDHAARVSFDWTLAERPPPPIDALAAGGLSLDVHGVRVAGVTLRFAEDGASDPPVLSERGTPLAESLLDFLDRVTLVGCAGPLDSFRTRVAALDPFSDEAILWRRWLGLKVLS